MVVAFLLLIWFAFCLPAQLFNSPYCTVVEDRDNQLLSATIAEDGQWRFPEIDEVPVKFEEAILLFEDEYFYKHLGVNPISLVKAFVANVKSGGVKRGGSTLTMQVIRLSRENRGRTFFEKFKELFLATRLEFGYSKKEILSLYASNAPFGGNVVGLEAASWRYYGRSPKLLSWGEMTTLAVLPNAPSLIYPGKNHELLLAKRNRLLDKLLVAKKIDETTCELAKLEPLPLKPYPLNQRAIHLLTHAVKEGKKGERLVTTLEMKMQDQVAQVLNNHYHKMVRNDVHNASVLVVEVETGNVLAYVGNSKTKNGGEVDMVTAPRSTGSILKPLLYAAMLDAGQILPKTLLADIPTQYSSYTPKNFDKRYDGAVAADNALIRSLNIPAVRMLKDYGVKRFHNKLKELNMSTLTKDADHYGLSLILGGAETTMNDLASIYGSMARTLNNYTKYNGQYNAKDYSTVNYNLAENETEEELTNSSTYTAASIYTTFNVMSDLHRPREERGWENFSSLRKVAWKTGTSFGHRDAWAVGVTPEYVVVAWVGNATGEGKSGLTGISAAAPLLFDVFKKLPKTTWFSTPYDEMEQIPVCTKSGMRSSMWCEKSDSVFVPLAGLKTKICAYHKWVHLDENEEYMVNNDCYPIDKMKRKSWFVLPPVWEWYYKTKDPNYKALPPFMVGCEEQQQNMEIIYPSNLKELSLAKNIDGTTGKLVFEVAHRNPETEVFWHIDEEYVNTTNHFHQIEVEPEIGQHILTIVDENGETITKNFSVIE
ncbi:MAG: penicillin-binding protein 1C [Vicingaceae bacterium]|nr:penicillin-binding protein 1C [Vicingaceae bacterium]